MSTSCRPAFLRAFSSFPGAAGEEHPVLVAEPWPCHEDFPKASQSTGCSSTLLPSPLTAWAGTLPWSLIITGSGNQSQRHGAVTAGERTQRAQRTHKDELCQAGGWGRVDSLLTAGLPTHRAPFPSLLAFFRLSPKVRPAASHRDKERVLQGLCRDSEIWITRKIPSESRLGLLRQRQCIVTSIIKCIWNKECWQYVWNPSLGFRLHHGTRNKQMYRSESLLSPCMGQYQWTAQTFQLSSSVGMEMTNLPIPCTPAGVFREQKNREEVAFFSIKNLIKRNWNKVFVLPSCR